MKKIMLICQAGVSANLLQQKITEYIDEKNLNISIKAISNYEIKEILKKDDFDILLFTPHLKLIYESYLKEYGNRYRIEMIDIKDFVEVNVENIISKI